MKRIQLFQEWQIKIIRELWHTWLGIDGLEEVINGEREVTRLHISGLCPLLSQFLSIVLIPMRHFIR